MKNLNEKVAHFFNKPSYKDATKRTEKAKILEDAYEIPVNMVNAGKGKTFHIRTYGCQSNERDTETMGGILETLGYTWIPELEKADVAILNTCAIRENAENKVFGQIGWLKPLKKERPDMIIGVCGCMAQEEGVVQRILSKHPEVDLIFGTHNIHMLPTYLESAMFSKKTIVNVWSKEGDVVENLPVTRKSKIKAYVNIMFGCDHFCTYCIVPYTRGKERSRVMKDIVNEVIELKEEGYKEVTLLGQNVNSWAKDLDSDDKFSDLLDAVAKTEIERIRFTTSNPWNFTDELINVITNNKNIMPHIHLPAQSGNNTVLRRMARRNTVEEYLEIIRKIRIASPNIAISTDLIVGFPGETQAQFEDTLKLYKEVKYDTAYTFIYSKRENTPAMRFKDVVTLAEKSANLQTLNELVKKYSKENNEKWIGKTVDVLVEGPSKRNENILSGYSPQWKVVNFPNNENKDIIGKIIKVKITEAKRFSLNGELI